MRSITGTLVLALSLFSVAARGELAEPMRSWNRPVEPFRVIGNVYYVGSSELASILIETPDGLILIDSGLPETVPQIVANVKSLGFDIRNVKLLLATHPHFDHAGGLAEMRRTTGATLVVSAPDAAAYARGDRDHHTWGNQYVFEPVVADRLVAHGETVTLGGVVLTANVTPGHTDGCTTWSWKAREGGRSYDVVFVGSSSVPGYQLVGNPKAPDLVAQYEEGFRVLESLSCDVFLAAHGWFFDFPAKRAKRAAGASPNPFIDPEGYRKHVADMKNRFQRLVIEQTAGLGVDAIYRSFAEAYAKLDSSILAQLYEEDALYLTPSDERGLLRGSREIAAYLGGFFDSVRSENAHLAIRFSIVDRQATEGLVTDVGYYELTRTGADGATSTGAGKFTTVARRQRDGSWKFRVDGHSGAPVSAFAEAKGRVIE